MYGRSSCDTKNIRLVAVSYTFSVESLVVNFPPHSTPLLPYNRKFGLPLYFESFSLAFSCVNNESPLEGSNFGTYNDRRSLDLHRLKNMCIDNMNCLILVHININSITNKFHQLVDSVNIVMNMRII